MSTVTQSVQIQKAEEQVLKEIITGYKKCRNFFSEFTNEGYEIYTDKKKEFLTEICNSFYVKFKQHKYLFPANDEEILERIKRSRFVPIKFSNGGFEYPRSFTVYMDRIKDINVIPKTYVNLTTIDQFFDTVSTSIGLTEFFFRFFNLLRKIQIPLRLREEKVLKLISNPDFLKYKDNDTPRIYPPTDNDILQGLHFGPKQLKKVERAILLLYNNKICAFHSIIMNLGKLGYQYVLSDNLIQKNYNYQYWDIKFATFSSTISCIPFTNIQEYFGEQDYISLKKWYWNVDISNYSQKLDDPWKNFLLPDFTSEAIEVSKFREWDIYDPLPNIKYSDWQSLTLKNLSRHNNMGVYSIEDLNPEVDKKQLFPFLETLVKDNIFQYYPNIRLLGLDFKISLRFSMKDQELFNNIVKGMLKFPITHILTNDEEMEGIGYFHIPRRVVSQFIDNIFEFKRLNKEKISKLELNLNNTMKIRHFAELL